MLTKEQNDLVTQTDAGTPCGDLLRRYWQPAALTEELTDHRAAKAVRLMGEDLVLFRDEKGDYGLVSRACPHRGADLAYGRLEDGGLRCPFHGWLFDVKGKCLEMPAEPLDSNFHTKVTLKSYPCEERNGIIFAYMGPGEPPALPSFDCYTAPDSHTFAFKGYLECNWLQVVEVGIDPSHASYLHRYLDENEIDYGLQFGGTSGDSDLSVTSVLRNFDRPEINVVPEDFGLRIITTREINPETMHVRVTNMVFPNAVTIPMTKDMCITQWHVPIDDTHSWWYCIFTDFHNEVDKETMREQRLELYTLPDYKPRINMRNDYGYDPEEQRNETYTGMGRDINVHDQWAVESAGPIFDRSQEHLGSADKAITAFRKLLLQSIEENQAGKTPPVVLNGAQADAFTGPMAIDTVASMTNWQDEWQAHDRTKRGKSPWANQNPI